MKNIDPMGAFLYAAIAFVIATPATIIYDIVSTNRKAEKYIPIHKCVIVNYAGEDAEPIYQCDTGLKRKRDM